MTALRVQVHFNRNSGPFQSGIVGEGLLHAIYLVVLVLKEKGWRRLHGKMALHILLESETILVNGEMSWVDRYGEVWSAAHVVSGVYARVNALFKVNASGCYKVTARRKANNAYFSRINVPLSSMESSQADRPLCVVQRLRSLGICT
jgi:hypothetical protein